MASTVASILFYPGAMQERPSPILESKLPVLMVIHQFHPKQGIE
jgi:hypothetical protein